MASKSEKGEESPNDKDVEQGENVTEKFTEKTEDKRPCCFKYCFIFTKIWAVLTLAALWYLSVTLLQRHHQSSSNKPLLFTQYYLVGMTIFITILELLWAINKCTCCKDDGNCCCTVWRLFMWFDNWKKGLLYFAISIPTFIEGPVALLGIISGVLVIVLGLFYIFKSIGQSDCIQQKKYTKTRYVEVTSPKARLVSHEVQMGSSDTEKSAEKNYKSVEMDEKKPVAEADGEPTAATSSQSDKEVKAEGANPFDEAGSEGEEVHNK